MHKMATVNIKRFEKGHIQTTENMEKSENFKTSTFEEAVTATKFGKFNILLMLFMTGATFSQVFETVSPAYILSVAQCDLNLTLEDKGRLNAMSFAGMITSGFFSGYLSDTFGRKKILVYGYILNGLFSIFGAFSTHITVLLISKFFSGLVIVGGFSAATAYLSEFHASRYRARVQLVRGLTQSLANIALPLLAWGVLPRDINFSFLGFIDFHSWNAFLLTCALVPIISGIIFMFMPESPKFLMTAGRNDDALEVFRKVYSINTGKSAISYPVNKLVEERNVNAENTKNQNTIEELKQGLKHIKLLFFKPLINKLVLVCFSTFLLWMSINNLKLWLPQLFQVMNDYKHDHNGTSSNICDMLDTLSPEKVSDTSTCVVNLENDSVYINSMIVGMNRAIFFAVTGLLVNLLGKKNLSVSLAFTTGCFSIAIYFSQNSETVLALSSLGMSFGSVCDNIIVTTALELFPTTLRTIALSLLLISGRVGIIAGSSVFPYLLESTCSAPFLFVGALAFAAGVLCILLPNTENKALE